MQGIFISYRRQDSQSAAGRLADHVKENMPGVPVFRDVETIEPGVDFTEAINRALQSCGVLLAVIGPHWGSIIDAAGRRRLDNSNDYTRLEISTALARPNVRVIPVLVEGAQMPEPADLPEDLQALCRRNAIELTDKRWSFDVSQLIEALHKALDIKPPQPEPPPPPAPPPIKLAWYRRLSKKHWAGIAIAVVVIGILGEQESGPVDPYPMPSPTDPYEQPPSVNPVAPPPASLHSLNGDWQDDQGGRYRL
ncbi:MAG: toll/interleukin-1 receptor domain-containing protein, partial [Porticoccaceae bacterium]